jgi:acetyl esterase/lipase
VRQYSNWLFLLLSILFASVLPAEEGVSYKKLAEIPYAAAGEHKLFLDLYLPNPAGHAPLIVWVHGGAWRAGGRSEMPLAALVEQGFAVASVDYRLSPVAKFPAQIHDIKAAVRFLRAKQSEYGFDAKLVAVAGSSAGAHLAALAGVTNAHAGLEGSIGEHRGESSEFQAIVSYFGASNFTTILKQSTPHGLNVRVPALELLLGGSLEAVSELARLASPIFHVDSNDPPLLLLHGDQDPQMPINQSHELQGRYDELGLPVQLEVVHGAAHGGAAFYDAKRTALVKAFLDKHLRGN